MTSASPASEAGGPVCLTRLSTDGQTDAFEERVGMVDAAGWVAGVE
jgi:hypothetical protein